MCNDVADNQWRGVGVTSWGGRLQAFEQCTECGEYRARILDENDVSVVKGQPSYERSQSTVLDEQEARKQFASAQRDDRKSADSGQSESTDDDPDGWLIE